MEIIDTGVGISPENLPNMFMDFNKLDEHASMNRTGTGLGLSICKKMIEMMEGEVRVESEIDRGTKFIVTIRAETKLAENLS